MRRRHVRWIGEQEILLVHEFVDVGVPVTLAPLDGMSAIRREMAIRSLTRRREFQEWREWTLR